MATEDSSMGGRKCEYCGDELSENALYCPNCMVPIARPARPRRPSNLTLCLSAALVFGLPCVWAISGEVKTKPVAPATVQAASKPKATAPDAAALLISRCGPADQDVSTANNDPRPPIPFRVLTYDEQHLRFAFVPGGGAQIGDPPPYRWALSGILDMSNNERITAEQAAQRMSCVDPTALASAAATPAP
jgi:predicted RNA-binding Zn-ribbon protein involved in translation (DUF1610 family)